MTLSWSAGSRSFESIFSGRPCISLLRFQHTNRNFRYLSHWCPGQAERSRICRLWSINLAQRHVSTPVAPFGAECGPRDDTRGVYTAVPIDPYRSCTTASEVTERSIPTARIEAATV